MRRCTRYNLVMDFVTCILIVFILSIDQGDGHWDKKERENLRHDIVQYKKMTEKIEREIEKYYDEYPEGRYQSHNSDKNHYNHIVSHKMDNKNEMNNSNIYDKRETELLRPQSNNMSNDISSNIPVNMDRREAIKLGFNLKKDNKTNKDIVSWPKFEDMLLAMGKKYDWKNDRWVKVKRKLKKFPEKTKFMGEDKSVKFHEKHNFSYRMVKLNRGKSRRNVVVAVSAVR